jgi:hypothetical protein
LLLANPETVARSIHYEKSNNEANNTNIANYLRSSGRRESKPNIHHASHTFGWGGERSACRQRVFGDAGLGLDNASLVMNRSTSNEWFFLKRKLHPLIHNLTWSPQPSACTRRVQVKAPNSWVAGQNVPFKA